MLYLDSSALLKLVIAEKESRALQRFLKREGVERVSCTLARTEVLRATRPHGAAALERARALLQTLQLVQLDHVLSPPPACWTRENALLDAIHLAARPHAPALIACDLRQADGRRRASRLPGRVSRVTVASARWSGARRESGRMSSFSQPRRKSDWMLPCARG
jgi:predicted nucleic acid-binding protein